MDCNEKLSPFDDDIVSRTAAGNFGIRYLYPMQRMVIGNVLDAAQSREEAGYDNKAFCKQIVLLPTGAGKSFCFLIPALLLDGPTLVIYPLLSLMADQKRRLDSLGIPSAILSGSLDKAVRENEIQKLEKGTARIALATPEFLLGKPLLSRLEKCKIAHVAVDEAHCVGDWGDSFRPAYLRLGAVINFLRPKVTTAFTATASAPVLKRIKEVLFDGEAYIIRGQADRPNIHYSVIRIMNKKKEALRLALTMQKPMIIFCGSRYRAEDMAREIAALLGDDIVKFYHAGMEKDEKKAVESSFFSSKDGILCATCAYGMGVDKSDIRTVLHLEAPMTTEEYMQESGRAGRDGKAASAILLWSHEDTKKFSVYGNESRENRMLLYALSKRCRRQMLLEALGSAEAKETVCTGCDICDNNGKTSALAADGELALAFIKKHRKLYDKNKLSYELIRMFNSKDRDLFSVNVWEHSDVEKVLDGLEQENLIRRCRFPWQGRITDCKEGRKLLE
ncbi:MAG: ATP-dependent DNA helicase RecQ [Treponema sp.]|nr:ATP-dependent DNA helicase RecQ [Treponema sp.]